MAAPSTYVRDAGVWKKVNKIHINVGGVWKVVNKAYVREAGVWKQVHTGVTPGSVTYSTPGTYDWTVENYNSLNVKLFGAGGGGGGGSGGAPSITYYNGGSGGASKWDNGAPSGKPQANGGSGGNYAANSGTAASGTASGGTTNTTGGAPAASGNTAGRGGSGKVLQTYPSTQVAGSGGPGAYCERTYAPGDYTPGTTVQVVVGAKGNSYGGVAQDGRVTITWS